MPSNKGLENFPKNVDIKNITIEADSKYCIAPGCDCGRQLISPDAERVANITITFEVVAKNPEGVEKEISLDILASIGSDFNATIHNPLELDDGQAMEANKQWWIFLNWLDKPSGLVFSAVLIESAKDINKEITRKLKSSFQANNKPAKETMH